MWDLHSGMVESTVRSQLWLEVDSYNGIKKVTFPVNILLHSVYRLYAKIWKYIWTYMNKYIWKYMNIFMENWTGGSVSTPVMYPILKRPAVGFCLILLSRVFHLNLPLNNDDSSPEVGRTLWARGMTKGQQERRGESRGCTSKRSERNAQRQASRKMIWEIVRWWLVWVVR